MDRHNLAFLIEGIISFILIVVLSLFVNLQSANAMETEKKMTKQLDNLQMIDKALNYKGERNGWKTNS